MARPRFKTTRPANKPAAPMDPVRQKAWRAVQKFNRMIPSLNSFVRMQTGNKKLRVQAGPMTCTNKSTVFIRPPLALGEDIRHDRMLCDERDADRTPLCPACAQEDDVWKSVHHELAHHLGDSMARPVNYVIDDMFKLVDTWHPAGVCTHGGGIKTKMKYADDYLVLFGAFSPFLEHLSQAIEDARIDSAMLNIKPGLRDQFYSFTYRTFTHGSEQNDGTRSFWKDAPLNAQLVIGCLLIGSGYHIAPGWLSDRAIEVLQDAKLREIVTGAHAWQDVHVGATHTIQAFLRLHEMGYLQVPSCAANEEPPPSLNKPGEEGDESDDSSDESNPGEDGDGDPGDEPGESESDDGPGDDAGDPTGDGTAGDTASDGAFGDDFENEDDRSSGSDQKGGDDDAESEGAQVPDDAGDDDEDEGGSAGATGNPDDEDTDQPSGDDSSGAGGEAEPEDEGDAGDAGTEEGGAGGPGSAPEAGDAGTDGDEAASDGTGDGDGEPEADDEGSDSEPGYTEDEFGDEDDASLETDEADDPVGEEVWGEDYDSDELKAARTVEVENPGDEHEVAELMKNLHGHDDTDVQLAERGEITEQDEDDPYTEDEQLVAAMKAAIEVAINQAAYFDRASQDVGGVKEITFPNADYRWIKQWNKSFKDFMPAESTLGKALLIARRVFAENKRSGFERHLKSGRVDGRVLGKRAGLGDDRIFKHKHVPKKRDYVVGITIDCSGSNHQGHRMSRAKRAVFAKAELLNRLGVKFYITAHTGGLERWYREGYSPAQDGELHDLTIMWVKKIDEPWNDSTRTRLANIEPSMENYDGHTLEFHRKLLQNRQETDKILIYYTDGAMPAANYDEEVVILEDEILQCKKNKIALLAVGINTDSPQQYGFDTVQVDSDQDLMKVVEQLERHLLK
jgi:cobalamin biosynthesis protein CobT